MIAAGKVTNGHSTACTQRGGEKMEFDPDGHADDEGAQHQG